MTLLNPRPKTALPSTGWPKTSTRSTLPASEVGSSARAGFPVSPVPMYSDPSTANSSAPPLCTSPRGMPVSTGLGVPPIGKRTTRLSVAVET